MGFKSEYDQNPHFAQRILGILVLRILRIFQNIVKIPRVRNILFFLKKRNPKMSTMRTFLVRISGLHRR